MIKNKDAAEKTQLRLLCCALYYHPEDENFVLNAELAVAAGFFCEPAYALSAITMAFLAGNRYAIYDDRFIAELIFD